MTPDQPNAQPDTISIDPRSPEHDPLWTEWSLANGIGGFAMGSVLGVPTRRYHGLLVAAARQPLGRTVVLTQLHETLTLTPPHRPETTTALTPMHFVGAPDRPCHDPRLVRFEKDTECRWTMDLTGDLGLPATHTRTVHLLDQRNAVVVRTDIDLPEGTHWRLTLRPLVAMRDAHELLHHPKPEQMVIRETPMGVIVAARDIGLLLSAARATFAQEPTIWRGIEHIWDARRGQDASENLICPGAFTIQGVGPGSVELHAAADSVYDASALPKSRAARWARLAAAARHISKKSGPIDAPTARLLNAADAFVVSRGTLEDGSKGSTIIAGYPWFADWGRDTMIALPGLMLATGRFREAFAALRTFARARRRGLIPNRFDDHTGTPYYNTVDASLWFIEACRAYLHATGDRAGYLTHLAPACRDIIEAYRDGTPDHIALDHDDGLIACGNPDTQLTWMDAQRDGVTFTPRFGKPVEINALWYNALVGFVEINAHNDRKLTRELEQLADRCRASFRAAFIRSDGRGLADCLEPEDARGDSWSIIRQIRCNQIFAASLHHSILDEPEACAVVQTVREHLLTPVGLRTLAPGEPGYEPRFAGSLFDRDRAYHNGTVWPWLIGAYADAVLRWCADDAEIIDECRATVETLADELAGSSIGQLWEVYDAEPRDDGRRHADGCIAQAWSVAETLRAKLQLNIDRV